MSLADTDRGRRTTRARAAPSTREHELRSALAEAERKLARQRALLDRVGEEIYVVRSADLRVLESNRTARERLGYSEDELTARTLADICELEDGAALADALAALQDDGALALLGRCRRKNGSRYPVALDISRLDGDDACISVRATDQSDLAEARAQMQLAASAANWHFTTWHLDSGEIVRDPEVDRMYGFKEYDPDRPRWDFRARVHPEDLVLNNDEFIAVSRGERPTFDRIFRVIVPGGTRWIHAVGRLSPKDPRVVFGLQSDVTATVEAEHAAEQVRKELTRLLSHLPDFISRADPDTTLRFVNAPYARYLGCDAADLVGRRFIDFVPEEQRQETAARLAALTPDSAITTSEEQQVGPDGEVSCLLWTNLMVFEDGRPVELVSVGRDITDQYTSRRMIEAQAERLQRSNAALMLSESRYRALYNTTPVMLHSSIDGRLVDVSDYWLDTLGYERDEVVGRSPLEFLTPESRARATAEILPRFQATGVVRDVPYQVVRRDGSIIDCLLSATAVRREDGSIERALAVMIDVTDKKRAEEALARNQRELEMIFDHAPVRIWFKDEEGKILRLNRNAADGVGVSYEEAVGRSTRDVLPPEVAEIVHQEDMEVIRTGVANRQITRQFADGAGQPRWLSIDKIPFHDPDTGRTLLLATSTDITDLRNAQLTMSAQAEALQRSNEELEQFAYVASHDMRAPLRGIGHLARWIEEECGPLMGDDSRENMRLLRSRVDRLEQMLDGLLQYARVGRAETGVEDIALEDLVSEEFDLVRGERDFRLVCAGLPTVRTGAVPLRLVLRNLMSNAIKHHDRGTGKITVSCAPGGDRYRISVNDDGPGIRSEHHKRAFGMFQVLQSRDKVESSGLGLAVIEKQLRQLSCRIWIESDPQQARGTTMHFTWPIRWPYGSGAPESPTPTPIDPGI